MVSVTPFCDGWELPRPGVFNREIVAFCKERLPHYQNQAHLLTLNPGIGVTLAGGRAIPFGAKPQDIHKVLGQPQYTWKNGTSRKQNVEYYFNHGFRLNYRQSEVSYTYSEDMPLYSVEVMERDGWQLEIDGLHVFTDDKLEQMKEKYEWAESKKKKAVAFPALGLFTVGCGEKKNGGKGAEGKYVCLFSLATLQNQIKYIGMWD